MPSSFSRRAAGTQRGKEQIFLRVLASWRELLFLIAQSRRGAKGGRSRSSSASWRLGARLLFLIAQSRRGAKGGRSRSSSASWRLGARLSFFSSRRGAEAQRGEGADLPQRLGVLARASLSFHRAEPQRRRGAERIGPLPPRLGVLARGSLSYRAKPQRRKGGKEQIFLRVLASWREALFLFIAQSRKAAKGEGANLSASWRLGARLSFFSSRRAAEAQRGEGADLPPRLGVLARGLSSFSRRAAEGTPAELPSLRHLQPLLRLRRLHVMGRIDRPGAGPAIHCACRPRGYNRHEVGGPAPGQPGRASRRR